MSLVSHSLIYLVSTILNSTIPFLLLPILTRYLTPEDYGVVVTFQLVVSLLTATIPLNLNGAVSIQFFKIDLDILKKYIGNSITLTFFSASIVIIIICLVKFSIPEVIPISLHWLLLGTAVSFFTGISNIRLVLWQVPGKPIPYGIFQFIQIFLNASISLLLVINFAMGSDGRLLGIVASVIFLGVFAFFSLFTGDWIRFQWDKKIIVSVLRFGIPLLPHTLAGIAISQADRFIIGKQLSLAEAGVYAVSMQLSLPILMVAISFNQAYSPWLYKKLSKKEYDPVVALSTFVGLISIVAVIVYTVLAVFLIRWIVGEQYLRSAQFLPWIAFGVASICIYFMVVNPIFYAEKTEFLSVVTLVCSIGYLILGWFATKYFQEFGLALVWIVHRIYFLCLFQH